MKSVNNGYKEQVKNIRKEIYNLKKEDLLNYTSKGDLEKYLFERLQNKFKENLKFLCSKTFMKDILNINDNRIKYVLNKHNLSTLTKLHKIVIEYVDFIICFIIPDILKNIKNDSKCCETI